MKNLNYLVLATLLTSLTSQAGITPAEYALKQVRSFLENEAEQKVFQIIPPHKARSYIVSYNTNLHRGKFSHEEGAGSDFLGTTYLTLELAQTEQYTIVECAISATATVVPFAKQTVPVLETEINSKQLILLRHDVDCRIVH